MKKIVIIVKDGMVDSVYITKDLQEVVVKIIDMDTTEPRSEKKQKVGGVTKVTPLSLKSSMKEAYNERMDNSRLLGNVWHGNGSSKYSC